MKRSSKIGLGVLVILVLIQFIPIERNNPAVTSEIPAPQPVKAILKRACYDCHSNETVWPWYSRIAPVKFIIQHHVDEGRHELNFSAWDQMPARKKAKAPHEMIEEIEKGEMPTWDYLLMHPDAKLSEQDIRVLKDWAQSMEGAP